jgi:hypothetical protein
VAVKASSAPEIEQLIGRLRSADANERDAAVARLRVIGSRALPRLTTLVSSSEEPSHVRVSALRALDGADTGRARAVALTATADADESVAAAAVAFLAASIGEVDVLDAVTALALDRTRPAAVRLAAIDAVSQLPRAVVQPLLQQVATETTDGGAPDDPLAARDWLATQAAAPLSALHDFVLHARDRERQDSSDKRRQDWLVTRGAAHALLARRGSRVALYDLRESFDAADAPLPLDFLTAIAVLGDADSLEPLARAWAVAPVGSWWRARLADTATDIMHRLRLTGRSASLRRLRAKHPGFL